MVLSMDRGGKSKGNPKNSHEEGDLGELGRRFATQTHQNASQTSFLISLSQKTIVRMSLEKSFMMTKFAKPIHAPTGFLLGRPGAVTPVPALGLADVDRGPSTSVLRCGRSAR